MGTLSSELAPHARRLSPRPRVYADANVAAGLVAYMRTLLHWDVVFVLEDDQLSAHRMSDITDWPCSSVGRWSRWIVTTSTIAVFRPRKAAGSW